MLFTAYINQYDLRFKVTSNLEARYVRRIESIINNLMENNILEEGFRVSFQKKFGQYRFFIESKEFQTLEEHFEFERISCEDYHNFLVMEDAERIQNALKELAA